MSAPLLATKLFIPPLRSEAISRPHLLKALDEGLSRKLILVAAPAGYGKTTLISEWIRQVDAAVAWLSLEKNDNDLTRFLSYFIAALQAAEPEINQVVWPSFPSPQLPPIEALLTPLLNELAARDAPVVVVLDDFHLIEVESIYQALTFLLDHLPPHVHMVIATRADPRLPIARLRARGELVELREADLRFTPEEIAIFLKHGTGLVLSQDQLNKLASRTEGWIAGLQLAALSMQGKKDLSGFIDAFSGSHEYIVDYLTDEVIDKQPEDLQTFLLETSFLDRLSGPLCEAITGQDAGQATLESLRAGNLFILPLDDQRTWYRYHRLFADHLHKRLRQSQPDRVDKLHRKASAWFEQNGLMAEAIDHTLRAGDYDRAADLIERVAEETLMRSEFALYLRWADSLPVPVINSHPMLGIAQAMALVMVGTPIDEVERRLNALVCETETHLAGKSVVEAIIAVGLGEFSNAYKLARQAADLLSADEHGLWTVANWVISYTSALESKPSEGHRILEKVVQESRSSGNFMLIVLASFEIAKLYTYQGQLRKARQTIEQVLDLAKDQQGKFLPIAGEGLIGLGELSREENRLEEAEQALRVGIDLSKWGRSATSYRGYLSLAKLKLAQGDLGGTYDQFREAKRQAAYEFDRLYVDVAEARARLSHGEIEVAASWLAARGWDAGPQIPTESDNAIDKHMRKYEHLLYTRVLMAQNQPESARASLKPLLQQMEQGERLDIIIEIQILNALAFQAQGDTDEALAALEAALTRARPGGYVRIFVDEGEPMRRLLLEAVARGVEPEYSLQLLAAFPTRKPAGAELAHPPHFDLPEPLSARELQVLRLLASPLSSAEIAAELFISVNTARFHIKNIYGKLDVHRRDEAVDRARSLGII